MASAETRVAAAPKVDLVVEHAPVTLSTFERVLIAQRCFGTKATQRCWISSCAALDFNDVIRIFSDIHFGDRASSLASLTALTPLFEGATQIVLNGDTLDTRPSRNPAATLAAKVHAQEFFRRNAPPASWLTGNHDPDISDLHALEFAERSVYVTHGDILFENVVPWGRDVAMFTGRINAELERLSSSDRAILAKRFAVVRRVCATIPQRHQSERNAVKYAWGYIRDTVWPPLRILRVLQAWRETPARVEQLLEQFQLPAKVFVMGHTHRLGVTQTASGVTIINTGSFCPPNGGGVVDVSADRAVLRAIEKRGKEFRFGATLAQIALARSPDAETLKV